MTFKQTLRWRFIKGATFKSFMAQSSHGLYEVRSSKARNWTCWLNGRKLDSATFTGHVKAIDAIEQAYYRDPRQLKAELTIVDGRKAK